MPLIREEVKSFVAVYNHHRIRRQPNKPNSQPGRPDTLYHYPQLSNAKRYGRVVDTEYIAQLIEEDDFGNVISFSTCINMLIDI